MDPALRQFGAVTAGSLLGIASTQVSSSLAITAAVAAGALMREKSDGETGTLLGSWLLSWILMVN